MQPATASTNVQKPSLCCCCISGLKKHIKGLRIKSSLTGRREHLALLFATLLYLSPLGGSLESLFIILVGFAVYISLPLQRLLIYGPVNPTTSEDKLENKKFKEYYSILEECYKDRVLNDSVAEYVKIDTNSRGRLAGIFFKSFHEYHKRGSSNSSTLIWVFMPGGGFNPFGHLGYISLLEYTMIDPDAKVFCYSYRGNYGSDGYPNMEDMTADIDATVNYIASRKSELVISKVVGVGGCLGGAILAKAIEMFPGFFHAAIFWNTFRNIPKHLEFHRLGFLGPFISETWDTEKVIAKMAKNGTLPPVMFEYTEGNVKVSPENSKKLFQTAKDSQTAVKLVQIHSYKGEHISVDRNNRDLLISNRQDFLRRADFLSILDAMPKEENANISSGISPKSLEGQGIERIFELSTETAARAIVCGIEGVWEYLVKNTIAPEGTTSHQEYMKKFAADFGSNDTFLCFLEDYIYHLKLAIMLYDDYSKQPGGSEGIFNLGNALKRFENRGFRKIADRARNKSNITGIKPENLTRIEHIVTDLGDTDPRLCEKLNCVYQRSSWWKMLLRDEVVKKVCKKDQSANDELVV